MEISDCGEMGLEVTMSEDKIAATNVELWGLYDIRAAAYFNLLYYGARATIWSAWNLWLQVGAAVGSLGAVTGFLTLADHPTMKWISAGVGALSAVCAALPAIMGHAEKVNRFEKMHFAYCELFELTKREIMEIRRVGLLTNEQLGAAKVLNDLRSRLGQIDDPDIKDALRDRCEKTVRQRFPNSTLWYAGEHDHAEQAQSETATGATAATGKTETGQK
jgi:hypothetical protein